MSEANEDRTTIDFRELGQRLAEEVATFLKNKFISGSRSATYESFRLSFVGHSIGNIIIRSALTDAAMEPYLNNLYTFLSISRPHLGYLYSTNALFNSGLWLFKKLKGSPCMHQLTFTDEAELQNSFLSKLSKERTFEHFQNLILVSSPQDRYAPYHSARIEMCQAATRELKKGPAYTTMQSSFETDRNSRHNMSYDGTLVEELREPNSDERVKMKKRKRRLCSRNCWKQLRREMR